MDLIKPIEEENLITQKIKQAFNRSAYAYDKHSQIQEQIGHHLLKRLKEINTRFTHILDLGCGTGMVTEQLAQNVKYQKFYAIDIADQLLLKAKHRLNPYGIITDVKDFQSANYADCKFDLIFSNMALHWSVNLDQTFTVIYQNLSKHGYFVFSFPLQKTFHELPTCSKNLFWELSAVTSKLRKFKFKQIDFFEEKIMINFASPLAALRSIKGVGANYVFGRSAKGLHGKSFLKKYSRILTYHIGYFIARKIDVD